MLILVFFITIFVSSLLVTSLLNISVPPTNYAKMILKLLKVQYVIEQKQESSPSPLLHKPTQ